MTARIEDLTWSVGVALSALEAHIGEIRRLLCELDRSLLGRVRAAGERDHRLVMGLVDRLQQDRKESIPFDEFLSAVQAVLDGVRNQRDYRPSARSGTVVGSLWSLTAWIHPEGLGRVARSLARALRVDAGEVKGHDESIVAVLGVHPIRFGTPRLAGRST